MTRRVLLLGAGKIGCTIATFLSTCGDYDLVVADADEAAVDRLRRLADVRTKVLNAHRADELNAALHGRDCVVSALSYHGNPLVAQAALDAGASYFDLTEDIATGASVARVAAAARPGQIFMPQCGLAPGFVSIVAHWLTRSFEFLDSLYMRVGALPQFPTNALTYNLTWSTDGLINEYCNPCEAIHEARRIHVLPLEGMEHFSLDGIRYEAFNTSGGLGSLCESLDGKVRELNYKTIRYPGHRDLMALLVNDLRLGTRRDVLKDILESAVPITFQDVVVIFCTVSGHRDGQLVQVSDARKVYPKTINGQLWSAIQLTTASALCAVVDLHFENKLPSQGLVRQEDVDFEAFLGNRFGQNYQSRIATTFGGATSSTDGDGASADGAATNGTSAGGSDVARNPA